MDAGEAAAKREAIACHGSQLVLSRRRFLAYARALEAFRPGGTPFRPGRFLRRLGFEPGELRLEVSVPAWWHLFGKPRLLVIAAGAESVRSFTLVPPLLRRRLALQASPQAEVLAHGSCRRAGGSLLELTVPVPALPRTETLFVKLQRAGLPRDACGWVEIPAAAPSRRRAPVLCLVPCYDVAPFCEPVLRDALARADAVVAVDDGSGDGTGALLDAMAAASGGRLQVLHFDRNRGKGAALRAGFLHVLERFRFDVLVTMDGDGQHRPADIPALVAAVRGGADMAIGERPVEGMPLRSRLGNTVMGRLVRRRHQRCPADTQSGLRAFTRAMVREIAAAVPGHRYETELRVLLLALVRGRRIASVPVPAIYIEGNRSSHFRPVLDSLRVLRVLFDLPARDGDSVPAPPAERV